MENFFNTNSLNAVNTAFDEQQDDIKENYKKIFIEAAESIRTEINKIKPENPCKLCQIKDCKIDKKDIFTIYPSGCAYRDWQLKVITFLTGDYKQKLRNNYAAIMLKKENHSCSRCGNCCRLATSTYSYEQLKQRAAKGDKFSREFVSVFIPYESEEDVKKMFPDFIKLLDERMDDEKIYYYYCPKLKGNMCSDYKNRPDICKDFPYNPLKLLPTTCAFNEWKKEISKTAMLLNAKVDIIEFYKQKLS